MREAELEVVGEVVPRLRSLQELTLNVSLPPVRFLKHKLTESTSMFVLPLIVLYICLLCEYNSN